MHALHITDSPSTPGFLLVAGNLHDIRPHQTCTSTGMCQERELNVRDSGDWFQPGPLRTRQPVSAPVTTFRSRTVNVRIVLPFCSRLPLRKLSPTPIVGHPPQLLCLLAHNVAPRSTVCMILAPSLAYLHAKARFLLRLSRRSSA